MFLIKCSYQYIILRMVFNQIILLYEFILILDLIIKQIIDF